MTHDNTKSLYRVLTEGGDELRTQMGAASVLCCGKINHVDSFTAYFAI